MKNALDGFTGSVQLVGRTLTNPTKADEVVLLDNNMEELQRLQSNKVMKIINNPNGNGNEQEHTRTNNGNIENINDFTSRGSLVMMIQERERKKEDSALLEMQRCQATIPRKKKYIYIYPGKQQRRVNTSFLQRHLRLRMLGVKEN